MKENYGKLLPKSRMGKAIACICSIWPKMYTCLENDRLMIENNIAENAIRPLVTSRKNFLFCVNHEAIENMGVICSLLSSCRESDVNPREWFNDAIEKMLYYKEADKDVRELLPDLRKKE
jgi:hypothetical protein